MKIFKQSHAELHSEHLSTQDSGSISKEQSVGFASLQGPMGHLGEVTADSWVFRSGTKTAAQVDPLTPGSESPFFSKRVIC